MGDLHVHATFFCESCDYEFRAAIDCGDRLCLQCNRDRQKRIMRRFVPVVKAMVEPKFLTLTLKRRALCRSNVRYLRQCFTKLRHRKVWKATGGVYQIEIGTVDDLGQANLHIHAVVDGPMIEHPDLMQAWHDITGDSYIVEMQHALDARGLVWYMSKHMGKMPHLEVFSVEGWKHDLINAVLKGTRLVQGFGTLAHVSMGLDGATCPKCGSTDGFVLLAPWEPCHQGL